MKEIYIEYECNDTYGRIRMYQVLLLMKPEGVHIPSERTVYRVMEQIGLSHRPKLKPNGITKADREAMKTELLYDRYNTEEMTSEKLKVLIWRYFINYWNNRRIYSANGGLPPMLKRRQYYEALELAV